MERSVLQPLALVAVIVVTIIGSTLVLQNTQITGLIVAQPSENPDVAFLQNLQGSVNIIIYTIVGTLALLVTTRIGINYTKKTPFTQVGKFEQTLRDAESHIKSNRHHRAIDTYTQARNMYMNLKQDDKVKHYDRLYGVYTELENYKSALKAHKLADKYINGNITENELTELRKLLEN